MVTKCIVALAILEIIYSFCKAGSGFSSFTSKSIFVIKLMIKKRKKFVKKTIG